MKPRQPRFTIELWSTIILWAAGIGFALNVDFHVTPSGLTVWCVAVALFVVAMYEHSRLFRNLLRRLLRKPLEPNAF